MNAEIDRPDEQFNARAAFVVLPLLLKQRSRRPGSSLYLVTSSRRAKASPAMSAFAQDRCFWTSRAGSETAYRSDEEKAMTSEIIGRWHVFSSSRRFPLLVGRDLEERDRVYK